MRSPAPAVFARHLMERVAFLDLCRAQRLFERDADPDAPYYVVPNLGLEYRRFLLLRLTFPQLDISAPPMIDRYWRLHAADRSSFAADCAALVAGTDLRPDLLIPPPRPCERPTDPQVRELYDATFPCGATDLWGWPQPEHGPRDGAPCLDPVHLPLPSALGSSEVEALRWEADQQRATATSLCPSGPQSGRGSVTSGFGSFSYAKAGEVLHKVHWGGQVPRLIAAATGALAVPCGAYYNYYGSGEFISVHTDPYGHELVLLALLRGPVEPLHCHLDLVDTPLEEIQDAAQAAGGLLPGGTRFEINAVPFLMSGQRIPHHREPTQRDEEVVLLAQFYGLLVP